MSPSKSPFPNISSSLIVKEAVVAMAFENKVDYNSIFVCNDCFQAKLLSGSNTLMVIVLEALNGTSQNINAAGGFRQTATTLIFDDTSAMLSS